MGQYLDQIPEKVQDHIRQLTRTAGLPDTEESVEAIAQGWLEKKRGFEEQVARMNMEEVEFLDREDERGSLVMTYSGSLLNIGPLVNSARKVEYASIGLRKDVPQIASKENSELGADIEVDENVRFSVGPIKKSSPAFKIAVLNEELSAEEQEEKLAQATQVLTEEFVEVNKTLSID
jgi:hypothetical protein